MNNFNNVSLEQYREQLSKFKGFTTDPQWIWTLEYDMLINPKLGEELEKYIDMIDVDNLEVDKLEKIMFEIKNKSIEIMNTANDEKDIVKKWYLYRYSYAYYGMLEVIIEGSIITDKILGMLKEKYGENYLDVLKKVDNINPSILTNFSKKDGDFSGKEISLYLLMKKWQDIENIYHNKELIIPHDKAKDEFEKYVHTEYPYLSEIKGRNLLGIYLLNKLPIIEYEQLFKFFDIGIDDQLSNIIGGKNLGLAKLKYNNVDIPYAYAIPVDSVYNENYKNVLKTIDEGYYSIRSSATVEDNKNQSFAGLFITKLNIEKKNILDSIKEVYKSIDTERVIKYCEKFNTKKPYMSVVVQKFNEPEYSGVWLGNSLNTGHLEWTYGNGEKLVSGKVIPTYENWNEVIDKPFNVNGLAVGKKCIELQNTLNTISDFEWCVVDNKLLFVQFRPVTVKFNSTNTIEKKDDEIQGIPASSGMVVGKPNYLEEVEDIEKFNKGEILLADYTDPNWVPAMIQSSGIITAEGGFLSHSAIISRELGIPCVVGVGYDNIEKISEMDEILLDGNNGIVRNNKILAMKK